MYVIFPFIKGNFALKIIVVRAKLSENLQSQMKVFMSKMNDLI